jgi:hypothetical protein
VTYVLISLAVLLVVGVVAYAGLAGRRRSGDLGHEPTGADVTDRTVVPPAHPGTPIPGSEEHRRRQGKP